MSLIRSSRFLILICFALFCAVAAQAGTKNYYKLGNAYRVGSNWFTPIEDFNYTATGKVSWYGDQFQGKPTASGETFNKDGFSAAHKTLPLPTIAKVTNLDNGKSVIVRINDRGPFSNERVLDVSKAAAIKLGFERAGVAKAKITVLAAESKAAQEAAKKGIISPLSQKELPQVQKAVVTPPVVEKTKGKVVDAAPVKPSLKEAGKNIVQVGAFKIKENAEKLVSALVSYGNAAIEETENLYRVHFPAKTTADAEVVKNTLKEKGYKDTFIKK
ncbi:MAG: septal ring lytic transglycosylase RlpA family protein [Alphaproteobacteria bacterium]